MPGIGACNLRTLSISGGGGIGLTIAESFAASGETIQKA
jgi:hypothetical protein